MDVFINDELVLNKSTYNFYPNYIRIQISSNDKNYKILKGNLIISDQSGRNIKASKAIDDNFLEDESLHLTSIEPGTKIIIETDSIKDIKTNVSLIFKKYFIVTLVGDLDPKINPNLDVLINGNVQYKKKGIKSDTVRTIKIIPENNNLNDSLLISHVRGKERVSYWVFTPISSFKDIDIFKNAQSADRYYLTVINKSNNSKKYFWIPIN